MRRRDFIARIGGSVAALPPSFCGGLPFLHRAVGDADVFHDYHWPDNDHSELFISQQFFSTHHERSACHLYR